MSLNIGSRLGHYDVTALIGEGGIGEVYRPQDTKLDRDVALKILPQAFTDDPDRLARFERERGSRPTSRRGDWRNATLLQARSHGKIGNSRRRRGSRMLRPPTQKSLFL